MTKVDQMVIFYLMTKRRINLVRLILDFILVAINAKRRRHATLPYGIFLTRVFIRAQLSLDGTGDSSVELGQITIKPNYKEICSKGCNLSLLPVMIMLYEQEFQGGLFIK